MQQTSTKVTSRREAAANGSRHYFTGKPCKHGHLANRYVASGMCVQCNRDKVNHYNRNIRQEAIDRSRGFFTYPVHPDDAAELLAFAQALDLQRGRQPWTPPTQAQREAARRGENPQAVGVGFAIPPDPVHPYNVMRAYEAQKAAEAACAVDAMHSRMVMPNGQFK